MMMTKPSSYSQIMKIAIKCKSVNNQANNVASVFSTAFLTLVAILLSLFLGTQSALAAPENPCLDPVDSEMTAGQQANGYYFDHRSSVGNTYSQDCNAYYTVDINVPSSYKVPNLPASDGKAINLSGGFDQPSQLTESNCPNASETLLIYKRSSILGGTWSNWQLVNKQVATGTWVPFVDIGVSPYCALSAKYRITAPSTSSIIFIPRTDQYRVKVLPKLSGTAKQARIAWSWTY